MKEIFVWQFWQPVITKKSVHDRPAMIYLRKMTLVIYLWIRGWHKNSQENHEPFNVHILTHLLHCCDSHCNTFVSYMQQWESSVRFGESYHISHQHTYRGSRKKAVGVGAKNIPKESKVCGQRQKRDSWSPIFSIHIHKVIETLSLARHQLQCSNVA